MWIDNESLQELLDGTMPDRLRDYLRRDLEDAIAREEAKKRKQFEEKMRFCEKLVAILKDHPERWVTPTELQFMLYDRTGQKTSCSKIAYTIRFATIRPPRRHGYPIPETLANTVDCAAERNSNRTYYRYISK